MQRPCSRNLHQTIAASPVSSGSTTFTERIEPEGAFYLWNSREAAERFYSEAWKSMIAQRYRAQPEISFYDTSVVVENVDQKASAA
jgi:hypothetical protein